MSALLAPTPAWLQREGAVLAHRAELSGEANLELDCDILDWLAWLPGIHSGDPLNPRATEWLKMCVRYAGCLTGANRLLAEIIPGARWTFDSCAPATGKAAAIVRVPGRVEPFAGASAVRANALLAASIRAIVDALDARPPPPANDAAPTPLLAIVSTEASPCPLPLTAPSSTPTKPSAPSSSAAASWPGSLLRRWAGRRA